MTKPISMARAVLGQAQGKKRAASFAAHRFHG